MMTHRALVHWRSSSERGKHGLPPTLTYRGLSRFDEMTEADSEDAWSVELHFDVPPPEQADQHISVGRVRFLFDEAPQSRLRPGVRFQLFEGPTHVADVEVLD